MLRRVLALALLAWLLGFLWFAAVLPQPAGSVKTEGVIVLTGSQGRIGRGLEVLGNGWARQMLVSGVDKDVRVNEFQESFKVPPATMQCCVTLGYESYDTRSNARESARWIARNGFKSVRLVTTDSHMRRADYDLSLLKPEGVTVIRDAVPSQPSLRLLFSEYHKLLARRVAWLWGG